MAVNRAVESGALGVADLPLGGWGYAASTHYAFGHHASASVKVFANGRICGGSQRRDSRFRPPFFPASDHKDLILPIGGRGRELAGNTR